MSKKIINIEEFKMKKGLMGDKSDERSLKASMESVGMTAITIEFMEEIVQLVVDYSLPVDDDQFSEDMVILALLFQATVDRIENNETTHYKLMKLIKEKLYDNNDVF